MTEIELNQAVRAWLNTLPGTVESGCSDEVVRRAWGQFGKGNLEMFRQTLALHGFKPEPLGRMFILRLPTKPTGNADWERIRRMNNLAG
jgi:hypothetical protein